MKRIEEECRHEVVQCPQCQVTCLVGHDDDGQVLCANCGHSFRADNTTEITDAQLRELYKTAERRERSGWIAFNTK